MQFVQRGSSSPRRRTRFDIAVLLFCIRVWKRLISPFLGENCRFHPTCSCYAAEALEQHGLLRGSALAVKRLLRCNALVPGGIDPVPPAVPRPVRSSRKLWLRGWTALRGG